MGDESAFPVKTNLHISSCQVEINILKHFQGIITKATIQATNKP